MKKIYRVLTLMLLFVLDVNSATAQVTERWDVLDGLTEVAPGQPFVLRRGVNSYWNGGGGGTGYLNPTGAWKTEVDASCVYELEAVGTTTDEGDPIYALKNCESKKYLVFAANESRNIEEAFQFTAKLASAVDDETKFREAVDEKTKEAVGQCFIFCSAESTADDVTYMCYLGCPTMSKYWNTNDWMLFSVEKHVLTAREKLEAAINDCFPNGVEGVYTTGNEIGTYHQDAYDRALAAYEKAYDITNDATANDEEIEAAIEELYAAKAYLNVSYNGLTQGYYYIYGERDGPSALYDNKGKLAASYSYQMPGIDTLKTADLLYIWKLDSVAGKAHTFKVQNTNTFSYVGVQGTEYSQFPMVAAGSAANVTFNIAKDCKFFFADQNNNQAHVDLYHRVVKWQSTGANNQYAFVPVPEDAVQALVDARAHELFVDSLKNLIEMAEGTLRGCDVTFDGKYNSHKGLVTTITANAQHTTDGSIAGLFDGNVTSYFLTKWYGTTADGDYDWVQADFGHEVQGLYIKMTRRHNNGQNDPTRIRLTKQGEDAAETIWSDILFEDTVIYTYHTDGITVKPIGSTNPDAIAGDSSTAVLKVHLTKPARLVRLSVINTISNTLASDGKSDVGPYWNLSELRFYEDMNSDPKYKLVSAAARKALQDALDNAKAALENGTATRDEYTAIDEAIDAFWESYPDDSELRSLIKSAKVLAEAAVEGAKLGYFEEGAKAELNEAISFLEGQMGNEVLTLDEIAEYTATIKEYLTDFNSKLNKPENGKYYRIRSASSTESISGNYVYCNGPDASKSLRWGYKEDANFDTRLNTIWRCEKKADGTYSLRNLATGLYFGNLYNDSVASEIAVSSQLYPAMTADTLTFIAGPLTGSFNILLYDQRYVNAQPGGQVMVVWSSADANSLFNFEEVDVDEDYRAMDTKNIAANKVQIITLPYAVDADLTQPAPYKLLGQMEESNGTYAQFAPWEGIIPAGTPFVIQRSKEEGIMQVFLEAQTADDLLNSEFVYTNGTEQNGLVGCIVDQKLRAGLGIIIGSKIMVTEGGEIIAGGKGFFKEIPATDVEGDLKLLIEGTIVGIDNATITPNAPAAIYTIAGVKVNGKAQNLPKGLYIINGKKVIVK